MTYQNPNAPDDGRQVGFIQGVGRIWQTLSLSSGTYTLSFQAAQGGNNTGNQQVRVTLRPEGAVASVKTFLWCGTRIWEERDGTGATVTRRFFHEGEQRIGGSDAGNYYYSRDHLGSVREVTNSSGALKAVYDYDLYGKQTVYAVSGSNLSVDFGYTGQYFHAPSGLNLALYRAYNPELGRWISRDPLRNAEMSQGPNLYAYVSNDPINRMDLLGLSDSRSHRGGCCNSSTNLEWALVSENNQARWRLLMPGECVGGWWTSTDCEGMTCGKGFYKVWAPETYLGSAVCRTPGCDSFPYSRRRSTPDQEGPNAESPDYITSGGVGNTPLGYQYAPR